MGVGHPALSTEHVVRASVRLAFLVLLAALAATFAQGC